LRLRFVGPIDLGALHHRRQERHGRQPSKVSASFDEQNAHVGHLREPRCDHAARRASADFGGSSSNEQVIVSLMRADMQSIWKHRSRHPFFRNRGASEALSVLRNATGSLKFHARMKAKSHFPLNANVYRKRYADVETCLKLASSEERIAIDIFYPQWLDCAGLFSSTPFVL